jgi:hypothetical protein
MSEAVRKALSGQFYPYLRTPYSLNCLWTDSLWHCIITWEWKLDSLLPCMLQCPSSPFLLKNLLFQEETSCFSISFQGLMPSRLWMNCRGYSVLAREQPLIHDGFFPILLYLFYVTVDGAHQSRFLSVHICSKTSFLEQEALSHLSCVSFFYWIAWKPSVGHDCTTDWSFWE